MIGIGLNRRTFLLAVGVAGCAGLPEPAVKPNAPTKPIIIAHRGASGERPEHTLTAYRLAIVQGADFIEPDLVLTKDGVLVCRHENEIGGTTDVSAKPEFASRKATKVIDGEIVTGWFTEDFTLAELKTLRCKERLPQLRPENAGWDGNDPVPTFAEVCALARSHGVGVYPETKHPSYFDGLGLPHDGPLLAVLTEYGFDSAAAPVFIQSFEIANLRRLAAKTKVRLIQLMSSSGGPSDEPALTYAQMASPAGLIAIAGYAQGIGVEKTMIIPRGLTGESAPATDLIVRAHGAGLLVHAWTFRAENYFLPLERRKGLGPAVQGDMEGELRAMFAAGLDGAFCDFPAIGVAARQPG
jgi:glycerophosphoryl diester phosphodiesterase